MGLFSSRNWDNSPETDRDSRFHDLRESGWPDRHTRLGTNGRSREVSDVGPPDLVTQPQRGHD
jgi:hypothetical protein